jgi:hypothetical protein
MIAVRGDEITDLTCREAAGAGVGDLEQVCPCRRKALCAMYKDHDQVRD